MSQFTHHTLIIGAGISGLAAARGLHERGYGVKVLESSGRPGGNVHTETSDGFLVEAGPNAFQISDLEVEQVLREMRLEDGSSEANPEAQKRYIVRGGRPVAVPATPWRGVTSSLFSLRGKLGLLREPFVGRFGGSDEALGDFVRRRLNQEFLDYAINPMVGGVYAGDPEVLSVRHGFPKVYALEREHGSLIRGAIAKLRERRHSKSSFKSRLISWDCGLEVLVHRLTQGLDLACGVQVTQVVKNQAGWEVVWSESGEERSASAEHLVLALPAHALAELPLPENLVAALSPLQEIAYPPLVLCALGFRREDVEHRLDGFGMLAPQKERLNILGTLFSSTLFSGRAPDGHVLLSTFVGGSRQPRLAGLKPEAVLRLVQSDLNRLLGLNGEPVFERCYHWKRAIPQYTVGYGKYLERMTEIEKTFPGLYLLGNYRGGIALGKCLVNGWNLSGAIARQRVPPAGPG